MIERLKKAEKAILIGIIRKNDTSEKVKEQLDELAFLADTAGAEVIDILTQRIDPPHVRTFIGHGKLQELKQLIENLKPDLLIFDDELSPTQLRNLDKELKIKIVDRTNLILDIFAKRAKTAQARTQVELAQYQYLLPRLTRLWTHLERQRGGIGLRGPGETEIETDRRAIRNKIAILKRKLEAIDKQNTIQRGQRGHKVRVALVGYTNAGKSTTMNLLSKADVFAEDKLFATLDTTVRNVVIDNITFLLSDTVGFIRKLPHKLVESFKSTLDEVREADIIVHVADLSHPDFEQQYNTVNQTLAEIGASNKNSVLLLNKIDKLFGKFDLEDNGNYTDLLSHLQQSHFAGLQSELVFASVKEKINIDRFKKTLVHQVADTYRKVYPHYPFEVNR